MFAYDSVFEFCMFVLLLLLLLLLFVNLRPFFLFKISVVKQRKNLEWRLRLLVMFATKI